jgi:drug/metabolite transporter (DMT)-like permease
LIIASGALFTISDVMTKWLRTDYPVGETISLRSLASALILMCLIPWLGGWKTVRVRHWRHQFIRILLVVITSACFIGAIRYMPLANAVGIAFAGPLFTVILVGPMLGERVGWRRWSAVAVGFAGLLIVVRPLGVEFQAAALLPLCTAIFSAFRDILTRKMSVGDHSNATLMVSIWGTVILGCGTMFVGDWFPSQTWVVPNLNHIGLFALAGLFMGAGQYCIIESLRVAEAGLVAPFKYVSFLWALLFGFFIWGDVPDHYELLGVSLIIGSGLFIFFRERALNRKPRSPKD